MYILYLLLDDQSSYWRRDESLASVCELSELLTLPIFMTLLEDHEYQCMPFHGDSYHPCHINRSSQLGLFIFPSSASGHNYYPILCHALSRQPPILQIGVTVKPNNTVPKQGARKGLVLKETGAKDIE